MKSKAGNPNGPLDTPKQTVTVLDVTYISTRDGEPPRFIGLWYTDGRKCYLMNFGLDRADILALEKGDKGYLNQQDGQWDFMLRGS